MNIRNAEMAAGGQKVVKCFPHAEKYRDEIMDNLNSLGFKKALWVDRMYL